MNLSDEDLARIGSLLREVTGLPRDRVAGFVVMVAVYEEDDMPGGRIIASTPNLRTVATMLDVARSQLTIELDRLSELS